jgi:hypothetical protein
MDSLVAYLLKNPDTTKLQDRFLPDDAFKMTGDNFATRQRPKMIVKDLLVSETVSFKSPEIQDFLKKALERFGYHSGSVAKDLNAFIAKNAPGSTPIKLDGSNFRPAHLAAVYVGVISTPGDFDSPPGLKKAWEAAAVASNVNPLSITGSARSIKGTFGENVGSATERIKGAGKDKAEQAARDAAGGVVPGGVTEEVAKRGAKAAQDKMATKGAADVAEAVKGLTDAQIKIPTDPATFKPGHIELLEAISDGLSKLAAKDPEFAFEEGDLPGITRALNLAFKKSFVPPLKNIQGLDALHLGKFVDYLQKHDAFDPAQWDDVLPRQKSDLNHNELRVVQVPSVIAPAPG